MQPELLVTLEDTDKPLAVSLYKHAGIEEYITWLKIGSAVVEIKNYDDLDSVINILNAVKDEIKENEKG